MKALKLTLLALACASPALLLLAADKSQPQSQSKPDAAAERVARGKYLVNFGGCNDCHTPLKMTDKGPEPDMTRMLSGHPANLKLPPCELKPGPWFAATAGMTVWSGPWGTSYAANLTPDQATGMGIWTEEMFVNAMRTGKHMGSGRPILPPMPWRGTAGLNDDDIKAIFAYLRTIPAIVNQVPRPLGPNGAETFE